MGAYLFEYKLVNLDWLAMPFLAFLVLVYYLLMDGTSNCLKFCICFCLQLTVSLVLNEWQFADGSVTVSKSLSNGFQSSLDGSPKLQPRTGSTLRVKVVEGRALAVNSKSGKCDPYVKLQYGKVFFFFYLTQLLSDYQNSYPVKIIVYSNLGLCH
jgi:hypothetical protein